MVTLALRQNGKLLFNRDTILNKRKWSWPLSISIEICIAGICRSAGCLLGDTEVIMWRSGLRPRSYKILSLQKEQVQEAVIFKIAAFFLKISNPIHQKKLSHFLSCGAFDIMKAVFYSLAFTFAFAYNCPYQMHINRSAESQFYVSLYPESSDVDFLFLSLGVRKLYAERLGRSNNIPICIWSMMATCDIIITRWKQRLLP